MRGKLHNRSPSYLSLDNLENGVTCSGVVLGGGDAPGAASSPAAPKAAVQIYTLDITPDTKHEIQLRYQDQAT